MLTYLEDGREVSADTDVELRIEEEACTATELDSQITELVAWIAVAITEQTSISWVLSFFTGYFEFPVIAVKNYLQYQFQYIHWQSELTAH